jgi:hypothetical protein
VKNEKYHPQIILNSLIYVKEKKKKQKQKQRKKKGKKISRKKPKIR